MFVKNTKFIRLQNNQHSNMPWALYNWKNKNSSFFSMFNCDGCFDTDSLFTDSTGYTILCALGLDTCISSTDIADLQIKDNRLVLFPNPTSGYLKISKGKNTNIHLQVFNLSGKLVLTKTNNSGENIDVSSLESGIYFIKMIYDNKLFIGKFIKT